MLELFTKHVGVVQQTISQAKRKTKKTKITHTHSIKQKINQPNEQQKKKTKKVPKKPPYIKI